MSGKKQSESRIPVLSPAPLRRSGSLRLGTCPPILEHRNGKDSPRSSKLNRHHSLQSLNTSSSFGCEQEDDTQSVKSFSSASVCSSMSQCDHAYFARNGTTYSGRCKRYVVHCSPHSTETDDYLTPTQRTNRTIRKLRNLLKDAQAEIIEKDRDILKLRKEVVELRLLKVDSSLDNESNNLESSASLKEQYIADSVNISNPLTNSPHSQQCTSPPLVNSLSDSGHFEDLNSSKENHQVPHSLSVVKSLEYCKRQHEDEIRQLKEMHNEKVEALLQKITETNDRYYLLRPLYEDCKNKVSELEKQKELQNNLPNLNTDQTTTLYDLKKLNEQLKCENKLLLDQISHLKEVNKDLEAKQINIDTLYSQDMLNMKHDTLDGILNHLKDEEADNASKTKIDMVSKETLTEDFSKELLGVINNCTKDHCTCKTENEELKTQIDIHVKRIQELEDRESGDKDLYVKLFNKGVQAAKLLDSEKTETEQDNEVSIIPDLLQKLKIKQEELDSVKDKDYFTSDNLLSAKEAVSLWELARQSTYRRLLDARKEQPRHDPEMTLQFLKSAFYYFFTDKENSQGHLMAIESILGFNDSEKMIIERAFLSR